jgi:hypothetical protein
MTQLLLHTTVSLHIGMMMKNERVENREWDVEMYSGKLAPGSRK